MKFLKSNYPYPIVFLTLLILGLTSCSKSASWKDLPWIENYQTGLTHARNVDRPAFIYFQAKWCSWCHIYERDVLSHQDVMNLLRRDYVPVLVNYDARPDLMRHFGGFGLPYTVIVAPDSKVLARIPGILSLEDMADTLTNIAKGKSYSPSPISNDIIHVSGLDKKSYVGFHNAYLAYLNDLFDAETGELTGHLATGANLKRPFPRIWLYLMQRGLWPQRSRKAATAIHQRLWDDIDGGFFYFLESHQVDEHLETSKLLDANAWLSNWLAEAGVGYQDSRLVAAARQGMAYLQQTLWDTREGGFYQAQISDPRYYSLDKKARARRAPPAIDTLKRTDTNAQVAFTLVQFGERFGETDAYELAARTIDYLLQYHYQDSKLYHSRENTKLGQIYNLPEDLFWLLAAGKAVQTVQPNQYRQKQLFLIKKLATQWLNQAMKKDQPKKISVNLLGLIAWANITGKDPHLPSSATTWALHGIRIDPTTQPDELIFALMAWEQYLHQL